MSDADIMCMFSDLYWDAFTEFDLNQKVKAKAKAKTKMGKKATA